MTKKGKIEVIVKYFYPVAAGIETNILETYSILVEMGWDVTIHTSNVDYTKKGATKPLSEREEIRGLKVRRYRLTPFGFVPDIDWSKANVVCLHNFDLFLHLRTLLKALALKLLGKKKFALMLIPHGGFSPQWSTFPRWQVPIKKIYSYTLGVALINTVVDGIRSVSPWETQEMFAKGIISSRVKTITNGLEYEAYMDVEKLASKEIKEKTKELGKYIIQIARIYPIKNFETTIKALAKLPPEIKFAIVGPIQSEEYKEKLSVLIKELGLEKRAVFLGVVRGIDKYYLIRHAEAMVHMAIWEANCNVIHEAMSQKLLCIVSNTTGLANQIKNRVNGYSLGVYDHEALAQKIAFVIKNKNSKVHQKMKAINMKYVSDNSWAKVAERLSDFYAQK